MKEILLIIIMMAAIESCTVLQRIDKKLLPMPPAEQPNASPDPVSNPQAKDI